jgi:hypothetical protein
MTTESTITKQTRLHDLGGVREGLRVFLKLMNQGFEFHKDPRGDALLLSIEKYMLIIEREIRILESSEEITSRIKTRQ